MRIGSLVRGKPQRFLLIVLSLVIFTILLLLDAGQFFPSQAAAHLPVAFSWVRFGFSQIVAFLFLAVGSLVLLYARDRRVATLLFGASVAMMMTFVLETNAWVNNAVFSLITGISSAIAGLLFALLVLFFPTNLFPLPTSEVGSTVNQRTSRARLRLLLSAYIAALAVLCFTEVLYALAVYAHLDWLANALRVVSLSFYFVALSGAVITMVISYRVTPSVRARQQRRIFVGGLVLGFTPLLLFTFLPLLLGRPAVDAQASALPLILLPLALGYSILRYEILIFDSYIRRAVTWVMRIVAMGIIGYLLIVLATTFSNMQAAAVWIVLGMGILGPLTWWLAQKVAESFFFTEVLFYRSLVEHPERMASRVFTVEQAADFLLSTAIVAFDTQHIYLFVLNDDTGFFQLYPPPESERFRDPQGMLGVLEALAVPEPGQSVEDLPRTIGSIGVRLNDTYITRLAGAHRPLYLSEVLAKHEPVSPHYLLDPGSNSSLSSYLLVPLHIQNKTIAIMVLGERGDRQPYAGPDFEAIHMMVGRNTPIIENARLYRDAHHYTAMLTHLFVPTLPIDFQTSEACATAYAQLVAKAVDVRAEVWFADDKKQLRPLVQVGTTPGLVETGQGELAPAYPDDWDNYFYEGPGVLAARVPPCLPAAPDRPFAWLPLLLGEHSIGLLLLVYPRPHHFSADEQYVLCSFAKQLAAALVNVVNTQELRAAYERQKELDHLKNQFIMTVSHELRTPLAAVQGYIDLLEMYHPNLSQERRAEFIAKAQRCCDELTLLVENIVSASSLKVEAEHIHLEPVKLAEVIEHIASIFAAVCHKEERAIHITKDSDINVLADGVRLRQLLHNLISNALRYSPPGTDIDVLCQATETEVEVHIRDHGSGIAPADRARLFHRFSRLERDINSAVRGAGLGLFISKQLVEAMGGQIWLSETWEKGSDFVFTLKRAQQAEDSLTQATAQQAE